MLVENLKNFVSAIETGGERGQVERQLMDSRVVAKLEALEPQLSGGAAGSMLWTEVATLAAKRDLSVVTGRVRRRVTRSGSGIEGLMANSTPSSQAHAWLEVMDLVGMSLENLDNFLSTG